MITTIEITVAAEKDITKSASVRVTSSSSLSIDQQESTTDEVTRETDQIKFLKTTTTTEPTEQQLTTQRDYLKSNNYSNSIHNRSYFLFGCFLISVCFILL